MPSDELKMAKPLIKFEWSTEHSMSNGSQLMQCF